MHNKPHRNAMTWTKSEIVQIITELNDKFFEDFKRAAKDILVVCDGQCQSKCSHTDSNDSVDNK